MALLDYTFTTISSHYEVTVCLVRPELWVLVVPWHIVGFQAVTVFKVRAGHSSDLIKHTLQYFLDPSYLSALGASTSFVQPHNAYRLGQWVNVSKYCVDSLFCLFVFWNTGTWMFQHTSYGSIQQVGLFQVSLKWRQNMTILVPRKYMSHPFPYHYKYIHKRWFFFDKR